MMQVDEWKERWIGNRSAFQLSDNTSIDEGVLLSPAPARILSSDQDYRLTSGERKAKRRKIIGFAEGIADGKPLRLLSVPQGGGSLFDTVSKVLKARGHDWPKSEHDKDTASVWEDIDDHMTILRRAARTKEIEESPAFVQETILRIENPCTTATIANLSQLPAEPCPFDYEEKVRTASQAHEVIDNAKVKAKTEHSGAGVGSSTKAKGKISKGQPNIRQKVLTKSFKGSKPVHLGGEEGTPVKVDTDDAQSDESTNVYKIPAVSPFIYHKKKVEQAQTTTISEPLVARHLNKVLPVSPESEKTLSTLRRSILEELRRGGAEITTTDDPPQQVVQRVQSETQLPGTQALINLAETALFETPTKSLPGPVQPTHYGGNLDLRTEKPSEAAIPALAADTQAFLAGWTPWSAEGTSRFCEAEATSSERGVKFAPTFLTPQGSRLDAEPFAKDPHNPYTEWFLVWAEQNRTNTLVIATTTHEDVSWVDESEELQALPHMNKAIYYTDDPKAKLHTPANKGNEAMAYLTYILEHYDKLPDVSTFLHSHSATWHISELLNRSTIEMISRLSLEKVQREGYVNLRCDISPGCPVAADLTRLEDGDTMSKMNKLVVDTLHDLGETHLPDMIAAPCCAQFAVSREMIQRRPKKYYTVLRDWLLKTDYPNQVSGRIFEYLWHYFFTSQAILCPSEQLCWCDAYSICFESESAWNTFNDIQKTHEAILEEQKPLATNSTKRIELEVILKGLRAETKQRRDEAFEFGSNPLTRQKILRESWDHLKNRGAV